MKYGIVLFLALMASPALAGSFTPPAGCETYLTVQSRGCHSAEQRFLWNRVARQRPKFLGSVPQVKLRQSLSVTLA